MSALQHRPHSQWNLWLGPIYLSFTFILLLILLVCGFNTFFFLQKTKWFSSCCACVDKTNGADPNASSSGCWTVPGFSLVSDPVCDVHGQNLKAQRWWGEFLVWGRLNCSSRHWGGLQLSVKWSGWQSAPLKSETVVPCWKNGILTLSSVLRVSRDLVHEWWENKCVRWNSVASQCRLELRAFRQAVVLKKEPSCKVNFDLAVDPHSNPHPGHELGVVIESWGSWVDVLLFISQVQQNVRKSFKFLGLVRHIWGELHTNCNPAWAKKVYFLLSVKSLLYLISL